MGDEFLRTLTPSDPAQPKKTCESDCRLADRVEDQFTVRYVDSTGRSSGSQWQKTVNRHEEKTEKHRDRMMGTES